MGEAKTEELEDIPTVLYVKVYVRANYARPNGESIVFAYPKHAHHCLCSSPLQARRVAPAERGKPNGAMEKPSGYFRYGFTAGILSLQRPKCDG